MCDVELLAHLADSIQFSQMPDPCSMCKAMAASDATGWVDVMDCEMVNLCTHNVYELVPCVSAMHTS